MQCYIDVLFQHPYMAVVIVKSSSFTEPSVSSIFFSQESPSQISAIAYMQILAIAYMYLLVNLSESFVLFFDLVFYHDSIHCLQEFH